LERSEKFSSGEIMMSVEDQLNLVLEKLDRVLSLLETTQVASWPAPGSEDTELGVLMEPEVGHGETEIYAGVQA
jgi:hypothetical protein